MNNLTLDKKCSDTSKSKDLPHRIYVNIKDMPQFSRIWNFLACPYQTNRVMVG